MKKIIFGSAVLLIVFSLSFVISQTTGTFTIGNENPYVIADTFAVQDGAASWDDVLTIDTHNINTPLRFNVKDPNPDVLSVRLCVGTAADPSEAGDCDVVNYDFPLVTSGQHSGASGAELTYTYNTDPTGTLEGTPAVIEIISADCSGATCSKTYYADIIINDSAGGVVTESFLFDIINNVPDTPSALVSEDWGNQETHDQTPSLTWIAADSDNGIVDQWPADTLTYHIQVGAATYGDEDYLVDPAGGSSSATVSLDIPWGTPGVTEARTTTYVRIWSTDNLGINSQNYDTTIDLVDNLPTFVDLYLSDIALNPGTDSCVDFLPQNCFVNPTQGDYSSLNAQLEIDDTDGDCSGATHSSNLVLCLVDGASPDVCDTGSNAFRNYSLSFVEGSGTNCNFSISVAQGSVQGIEFFYAPAIYKLFLEANSQAGASTTSWDSHRWEYTTLYAPDYAVSVFLGDRVVDGGDDIQLGQWNPGLSLATMINHGNILLNIEWEAADPSSDASTCSGHTSTCWDLSTENNFEIDDDNIRGESNETGLDPGVIPEAPARIAFEPLSGLQICDSLTCDNITIDETLDTYFHIGPPLGLSTGNYQTDITLTIS